MAKTNILIEGPSGTGKSTICKALKERGYEAVDGDVLAYFGNPETEEKTGEVAHENWLWDSDKIMKILQNDKSLVFVCGSARNRDKFLDKFDIIFNLSVDKETLKERIKNRKNNPWGKKPEELQKILELFDNEEPIKGAVDIDATGALNATVNAILQKIPDKKMPVAIEKAKPQDAEAVVKIKRDCWLKSYINSEYGVTEDEVHKRFSGDALEQKIERRRQDIDSENSQQKQTFVAKINGKVVGYTAPRIKDGKQRVGALYVNPRHQGKGVGGALLRKSIAWHDESEPIYVYVVKYNQTARNLYSRYEFKETGKEKQGAGVFSLPEIEMARIPKETQL